MPKVSILMPCYNAADTLEESLESIAQQTFQEYELIAVDDGSSDATVTLLRQSARRDDRIQVFSIEHGGIISALNYGLNACKGTYIARMDADDRMHPERIEQQAAMLDADPGLALVSCLVRAFPEGDVRQGFEIYLDWLNALVSHEEISREIFVESPLPHPSVMFRRTVVEQLGGYQEHGWPEDYDLWLRFYLAGARFAKVPKLLLDWREHSERLTRVDSRYSLENFIRAKAHYLARGPLAGRDAVIVWGAGMMGRRLSKHLLRAELPLVVFVDIDPKKIGRTRRSLPIIAPEELMAWWGKYENPAVLAAVGARGARVLIRERLNHMTLVEGRDWWGVA